MPVPEGELRKEGKAGGGPADRFRPRNVEGKRIMHQILIAEGETAERERICALLQKNLSGSCIFYQARSGWETVELFKRLRPQVAILDVEMPELGGLEAARRIRQTGSPCMILFLSAFENFSHAREAISLRALDYLRKPCDEKALLRSVEEAIYLYDHRTEEVSTRMLAGETMTPSQEDHAALRLGQVRETIGQYIRENYSTELSMQDVARAMNYSDAYFCKLFKQCFHVNFSTYLNEYRIARAKELLQTTRLSIRDISLACGYTDANDFARIFKRITGMTPTEYRVC